MRQMLVILLALLFVPVGSAQLQILEDVEGDTQSSLMGQADLPAGVDGSYFDLLGLWVDEDAVTLDVTIQVGSLTSEAQDPLDSGFIFVDFNHGDRAYRIQVTRDASGGATWFDGRLLEYDSGSQRYYLLERLDVEADLGENKLSMGLNRDLLLDGNGTAPSAGRELTLWKAFTSGGSDFFGPSFVETRDNMPDSGFGPAYEVIYGLKQAGDAALTAQNPVRASNGEKGTFVYYVDGHNLGDSDDRFLLEVLEVPAEWEVTLPAPKIRIDANGSVQFPVIVTTPFKHEHGAFQNFILEMTNERDPSSVGRLQLGIRYLEVPQPAGHHDRLYFHSKTESGIGFQQQVPVFAENPTTVFMNTREEDPGDEDVLVPPGNAGFCCAGMDYQWEVYLEPGLQMGLDFDVNKTGDIQIEFESQIASSAVALQGSLVHLTGEPDGNGGLRGVKETIIAEIIATTPKAVNGRTSFDSVIQPKQAADLIPYSEHAALRLDLQLVGDSQVLLPRMEETTPHFAAGTMRLPLNEYRDPVEDVFNALAGLDFVHSDRAEKLVNPGELVLFNMTLRNDGAVDDYFDLRINGTNVDWTRILGDQQIFVPTGQSRQVVIAVSPPADAPDGDVVDLIVTAASRTEPTTQGNIRVVAVVDSILDHTDESFLVQDIEKRLTTDKKSPGFEFVALVAILGGLVAVLPRRRE